MTGIFTVGMLLRHESVFGIFLVAVNICLLSFGILKVVATFISKNEDKDYGLLNSLVIILLMVVPMLGVKILATIELIHIFDNGYRNFYGLYIIMVAVTALTLYLIQSTFLSSIELRNNLKDTLRSQSLEERVISNEITRVSEKWAKHIHGRLQSDLVIQAHRLQKAQELGDATGIESSIEHILSILRNPEHGLELPKPSFQDELQKRENLWSALVEVVIESSLADDQVRFVETIAVGECVEELISNAVRHGKANRIEIQISREERQTILISAIDDGVGMTTPKPGLGFHLFDHLSRGNWDTGRDEPTGKNSVRVFIDSSVLLDVDENEQPPLR
jgi:signal transduction histidine kinase